MPQLRPRAGFALSLMASALASAFLLALPATAQQGPSLRLLGTYAFPGGMDFDGTTVGGLSGLAYDAQLGVYYAICDDRSQFGLARFYTLRISTGASGITSFEVIGFTTLDSDAATPDIQPYERNATDLEEIALLPDRTLVISSERDQANVPWLRHFALDGTLLGDLPLPEKFIPASTGTTQTRGIRSNFGFEGLALVSQGNTLWAMNEEALAQDGPIASTAAGTNVRALRYDLVGGAYRPGPEYWYGVERIFATPIPADGAADNGVSALLGADTVLPEFDFLAMERSFVNGVSNDVNIWGVSTATAQNISAMASLPTPPTVRGLSKTLLVNLASVGVVADNLEGMALGPRLPNGRASLLLMTDDNFSATQVNLLVLFEIVPTPGGK